MNQTYIRSVLKKELSNNLYDSFIISFHGGEPLLEFDKVKDVCEWLWSEYSNKHIVATCPTNGTILNDEMRCWLKTNENRFNLSISIDGCRTDHNASRCESFDLIDLDFFASLKGIKAKMTVTPLTIHRMFENFLYLKQLGFDVTPSLAREIYWNDNGLEEYRNQLAQFVEYAIKNPTENLPPFLRYDFKKFAPRLHGLSRWNCGAGTNEIAYDIDGNMYPCLAYLSHFGKYKPEVVEETMRMIYNSSMNDVFVLCRDCICRHVCAPCHGMNFVNRGAANAIEISGCEIVKAEVRATALLLVKTIPQWKNYKWLRNRQEEVIFDIIDGLKYFVSNEL